MQFDGGTVLYSYPFYILVLKSESGAELEAVFLS